MAILCITGLHFFEQDQTEERDEATTEDLCFLCFLLCTEKHRQLAASFLRIEANTRPESANAVLADSGAPTTIAGLAAAIGVKERMFAAAEIHS